MGWSSAAEAVQPAEFHPGAPGHTGAIKGINYWGAHIIVPDFIIVSMGRMGPGVPYNYSRASDT